MTPKQKDQAWVEVERAANAKAAKRHRDAITGQYVDEDHVKANPDTTVTETRRADQMAELLLKRLETLEADVALLIDTIKRMGE